MSEQGISEGFIPVTGGQVWYRIVGPDRQGAPLLVLHGGPGLPHDYLEPLAALSTGRPVIFHDQLGCGNSDAPEDISLYSVERFVEEVDQVRAALKLEKLFILGQSWGSMLAVEYVASKGSGGIAGLILSGPFLCAGSFARDQRDHIASLPPHVARIIREKEASGDFDSVEYQQATMEFYNRHVCRMSPWPECLMCSVNRFNMRVYNHMWGPSEFTVTGTLKNADSTRHLPSLSLPVLYTCGRFDEATPATTAAYQALTPGAELIVFEDASHSHHLERESDYLDAVEDFLTRHGSGS